jgi:hypothetical protein
VEASFKASRAACQEGAPANARRCRRVAVNALRELFGRQHPDRAAANPGARGNPSRRGQISRYGRGVEDQDRTRGFYEKVLGATVICERDPVILRSRNSWIMANVGGPRLTINPLSIWFRRYWWSLPVTR